MQDIQHERPFPDSLGFPIYLHEDSLSEAHPSVYTNWHTDVEILYGLEGEACVHLDSESHTLRAGRIIVIDGDVLHTIQAVSPVCRYYCMQVSADFLSSHGFDMGNAWFTGAVEEAASLALYEDAAAEYFSYEPYARAAALGKAIALLVRLCRHHSRPDAAQTRRLNRDYPLAVMQALRYIREHLCENMSTDSVSKHVGVSKNYFCRMFRAYTNMTATQYINALRCDYASRLIAESGCNVSEAAHRIGVASVSYFTRLFKRHMGVTPSSVTPARSRGQGARAGGELSRARSSAP